MSVTDAPVLVDDCAPDVAATRHEGFADSLVDRLHGEFAGDRQSIHREVTALLAVFADARVQTFVPILVEKQVREALRHRDAAGTRPPA
jgi:Protein of unknown function (DUF3562)